MNGEQELNELFHSLPKSLQIIDFCFTPAAETRTLCWKFSHKKCSVADFMTYNLVIDVST